MLEDQGSSTSNRSSRVTISNTDDTTDTSSLTASNTAATLTDCQPSTTDENWLIGEATSTSGMTITSKQTITTTQKASTTSTTLSTPRLTETLTSPAHPNIGVSRSRLDNRQWFSFSSSGAYIGIGICAVALMAAASPPSVMARPHVKPCRGPVAAIPVPDGFKWNMRDIGTQTDIEPEQSRGRNAGAGSGFAHPGRRVVELA